MKERIEASQSLHEDSLIASVRFTYPSDRHRRMSPTSGRRTSLYVKEGRGTPLLVVGSSIYYRRTFSAELRRHFTLIFVDLRHFAPTYVPTDLQAITLDTYTRDIDQIRSASGYDKIAVVGHSVHGALAFEYARR